MLKQYVEILFKKYMRNKWKQKDTEKRGQMSMAKIQSVTTARS